MPNQSPDRPAIDYTDKDFESLRSAMLALATYRLPEWTDRSPSDVGMLLVDLFAYVGDVVSYYQDRIASESFLATAVERRSVLHLLRLILGTRVDERPMLRTFGTRLRNLVHDPNDDVLADIAEKQAREALLRWEPRIVVTDSRIERDPDDGLLQIRLAYVHMNEQVAGQAVVPLS